MRLVRAEPLAVPKYAAADAEGTYGDHGAGDREDARVLRRPGEQEPRGREQGDPAPGHGRSRDDGQCKPAAQWLRQAHQPG